MTESGGPWFRCALSASVPKNLRPRILQNFEGLRLQRLATQNLLSLKAGIPVVLVGTAAELDNECLHMPLIAEWMASPSEVRNPRGTFKSLYLDVLETTRPQ